MSAQNGAVFLSGCEPVRVWFAWHPACVEGPQLAERAAAALGDFGGATRAGTGLPVYFATSTGASAVPLTIPEAAEDEQVVVIPLLDHHFVAAPGWRAWLGEMRDRRIALMPVALDGSGYNVAEVRRLSYLRVEGERDDARGADLARRVVAELARRLVGERLRLLISYATADGSSIARTLRDAIARYPRLDFFLDEDHLASGEDFGLALERAIDDAVRAAIAVHTDHYHDRPWCRRELAAFRTPQPVKGSKKRQWHLRQLVVVDYVSHAVDRLPVEFAGAPMVRFHADRAEAILDRVVRGVVVSHYHRLRAKRLLAGGAIAPGTTLIDWVPDAHTMGALARVRGRAPRAVCFPEAGLSSMELAAVRDAHDPIRLTTFDSVLERRSDRRAPPRTVVGLSFGVPSPADRIARGLSERHLRAVLYRLSRLLVGHGFDVGFGGLIDADFNAVIAGTLRDFVRAEDSGAWADPAEVERRARGALPSRPMLINFARGADDLSTVRTANDLGIVRFVEAAPDDGRLPDPGYPVSSEAAPLTRMRRTMNGPSQAVDGQSVTAPIARVLIGGKTEDYAGALPGVIEEAWHAMLRGVPVYVVGLLGGAAHAIGRVIFRGEAPPAIDGFGAEHWRRLQRASGANGLTPDENRALFEATDLDTVIRLLDRGLTALLDRPASQS